jgi:hypothetical protein
LKSQEDVKTCRFWEQLRFTDCYGYEDFMEAPKDDLKFYWYNSYERLESWCGTCNEDIPRMRDTLDQYTPIPTDEVPQILALIEQHLKEEIPTQVPLPLQLTISLDEEDSKLAQDIPERDHRCSVFMGQLLRSTKPGSWFSTYRDYGCSLVPYGDHHYALLVKGTLHHLAPHERVDPLTDDLDKGIVSWQKLRKLPRIEEWNRQVKNERQINGQLHKDGFEPIIPLFVESVCVPNKSITPDGRRPRPVFTKCTVLDIDETTWVMGKVASSLS